MKHQTFTREQVIKLIDNLLERPDLLIDTITHESPLYNSEELLEIAEEDLNN